MRSIGPWIAAMMTLGAFALPAQDTLPGSRLPNAGVVRANGANASVFIKRPRHPAPVRHVRHEAALDDDREEDDDEDEKEVRSHASHGYMFGTDDVLRSDGG